MHFSVQPTRIPVSVVIPCYCCSDTIERALDSVLQQTCLPQEIILVEDGSPDDGKTWACLASLSNKYGGRLSIHVIRLEANQGAATARNRGWQAATQPYIAFLDADDAWHRRKLEYQYGYMQSHPQIALCGHGHHIANHSLEDMGDIDASFRAETISISKLLLSNRLVTPSVMVRADTPFRFRDGQRYVDDHLLWLEIALAGYEVGILNAPLVIIYKAMFGESGLSSNMWAMEKAELGNYWYLFRERRIDSLATVFLLIYSFAKYIRRLIIVGFRRPRKHLKSDVNNW
jgi:glycosyltransferase involved in cell wall biosynthesis